MRWPKAVDRAVPSGEMSMIWWVVMIVGTVGWALSTDSAQSRSAVSEPHGTLTAIIGTPATENACQLDSPLGPMALKLGDDFCRDFGNHVR